MLPARESPVDKPNPIWKMPKSRNCKGKNPAHCKCRPGRLGQFNFQLSRTSYQKPSLNSPLSCIIVYENYKTFKPQMVKDYFTELGLHVSYSSMIISISDEQNSLHSGTHKLAPWWRPAEQEAGLDHVTLLTLSGHTPFSIL